MSFTATISTIATLVFTLFSGYIVYALLNSFLVIRKNIIFKILSYGSCYLVSTIVIHPNDVTNVFGTLTLFGAAVFLLYKGRWIEKLSIIMILYPITCSMNYLTEDFGYWIFNKMTDRSANMDMLLHLITIGSRLPLWWLIYSRFKGWLEQINKSLTVRMWLIIDIVCMTSFVGIITVILVSPKESYLTYPTCLAGLITSLGCIYLIAYISKSLESQMKVQNLVYQQSYYEELEKSQIRIRKLRHDMNHHLSVIHTFFDQNERAKALDYFRSLQDEIHVSNRVFCKNSIVNAVMNAKYNLAIQHHIDCFFHLDVDDLLAMDNISLCTLFANSLDNAIEAASQVEDQKNRSLTMKARYVNHTFVYEITNTKSHPIKEKNGKFYTNKKNKESHGFGIQNIKDIVNSYEGTFDVTYTDTTFTMTIFIGCLL